MDARLTLSRAQLEELTGQTQPGRMVSYLERNAWVFESPPRRGDIPRVDLSYYKARMSGQAKAPRRSGPNLDFMLRAQS
jgi:hypothetical protein